MLPEYGLTTVPVIIYTAATPYVCHVVMVHVRLLCVPAVPSPNVIQVNTPHALAAHVIDVVKGIYHAAGAAVIEQLGISSSQILLQPSHASVFPSSHCSPLSFWIMLSPQ